MNTGIHIKRHLNDCFIGYPIYISTHLYRIHLHFGIMNLPSIDMYRIFPGTKDVFLEKMQINFQ